MLCALALAAPAAFCQAAQGSSAAAPAAGKNIQAVGQAPQKPVSETDLVIPEGNQPAGQAGRAAGAPAVSTWDFLRMLLILAAVVGFIYLLFFLLRKGSGKRIRENDLIRVLGSRSLSGNKALHLVEVGTSVFLVGASDGGVELISQITDKESLDSVKIKAADQGSAAKRTFQDVLADVFKPARRSNVTLGQSIDLLKRQRDRLRKM